MIVAAARVHTDPATIRLLTHRQRILCRTVVNAEADDASCLGPQGLRIGSPLSVSSHPVHVAMTAFGQILS